MATLTSAQGSEPTSMRFASSTGFDQPTFQAVKTLTFQILEPKPLRATQSPRGLEDCKRRKTLELAAELCEGYSNLPPLTLPLSDSCERGKILLFLASECSPADDTVIRALASFQSTPGRQLNISSRLHSTSLTKLRNAATPPYEEILEFVLKQNAIDGMGLLVALRGDLLNVIRWMKKSANDEECLPHLKDLDSYLLRLFSIWFSPGMLGM